MSYARWGDGDVYVWTNGTQIFCTRCFTVEYPKSGDDQFTADSPKEMLDHLAEHLRLGDKVPQYALDRLAEEERAMNDNKKSPEAVIKEADDLLASLPATKLEDVINPGPLFAAEVEKDLREGNIGEIRNPDGTLVDPKSDDDD
jgi:hypothetical protein